MTIALIWLTCFLTSGKMHGSVNLCPTDSKKSWNCLDKIHYFSKISIKIQPVSEILQNLFDIIGRG